jgi:hypothetical protein
VFGMARAAELDTGESSSDTPFQLIAQFVLQAGIFASGPARTEQGRRTSAGADLASTQDSSLLSLATSRVSLAGFPAGRRS